MRQLTSRADDTFDFVPTVGDVAVRLRAVDWARSPLGPVDGWSSGLRAAVGLCLGWGAPACLAWGPGRVLFYNDTCAPLFGDTQPLALGRYFSDCALAADPAIADAMRRAYQGETVCLAEHPVPIAAGDRTEERLYSFAFTPIRDANGEVAGVFQALTDVTAQALEARAKARRVEGDAALREANRRLTVVNIFLIKQR